MGFSRRVKLQFPCHLHFNWFGYKIRQQTTQFDPSRRGPFLDLMLGIKSSLGVM
jgi:hypothetical protein